MWRKVQADFLAILDTYDYFSEDFACRLVADVRTLLDEGVVDAVKFVWTAAPARTASSKSFDIR